MEIAMYLTPIHKALRIVGMSAMAKELGITRAAVYSWKKKNRIPAHHILKVEELSGVTRYELSPQIYGCEK